MKTDDTKICVKKSIVRMKVNGEKIEFKIFDALKLPLDNLECFSVCIIQGIFERVFQVYHMDPLEATLTHSFTRQDIEPDFEDVTDDIIEVMHHLEASPQHSSKYTPPFETLVSTNNTLVPSTLKASELELKQLAEHLTYAYLGENQTLPVIVAANLSLGEEEKLLKVLREHKIALGWTIADIKGISPTKCMYQILIEDEAKPTKDAQRRLNPHIKDVVKAKGFKTIRCWHYLSHLRQQMGKSGSSSTKKEWGSWW